MGTRTLHDAPHHRKHIGSRNSDKACDSAEHQKPNTLTRAQPLPGFGTETFQGDVQLCGGDGERAKKEKLTARHEFSNLSRKKDFSTNIQQSKARITPAEASINVKHEMLSKSTHCVLHIKNKKPDFTCADRRALPSNTPTCAVWHLYDVGACQNCTQRQRIRAPPRTRNQGSSRSEPNKTTKTIVRHRAHAPSTKILAEPSKNCFSDILMGGRNQIERYLSHRVLTWMLHWMNACNGSAHGRLTGNSNCVCIQGAQVILETSFVVSFVAA